jgi:hypothetical protein
MTDRAAKQSEQHRKAHVDAVDGSGTTVYVNAQRRAIGFGGVLARSEQQRVSAADASSVASRKPPLSPFVDHDLIAFNPAADVMVKVIVLPTAIVSTSIVCVSSNAAIPDDAVLFPIPAPPSRTSCCYSR